MWKDGGQLTSRRQTGEGATRIFGLHQTPPSSLNRGEFAGKFNAFRICTEVSPTKSVSELNRLRDDLKIFAGRLNSECAMSSLTVTLCGPSCSWVWWPLPSAWRGGLKWLLLWSLSGCEHLKCCALLWKIMLWWCANLASVYVTDMRIMHWWGSNKRLPISSSSWTSITYFVFAKACYD